MFNKKKYYKENREKFLKYGSQWQKDNPEKVRKYVKKWKKNNPEKVREQKRRYRENNPGRKNELSRLRRKKLQEWVNNYKLSKGCAICGYNKCAAALDFHHEGDKEFGIAEAIGNIISFERIKKEIEKSTVICANCHRELEYNRKTHHKQNSGVFRGI